jgi:hypothetical protein
MARMRVTMLLADMAQVAEGKLYIMGAGWSITGPQPMPQAVVLKLDIERYECDRAHHWELFLEDADGRPILLNSPEGAQPVEVRGEFSVGEPDGVPDGAPVDLPIAINFGPLPLEPASRYVWRLVIDGETPQGGTLGFSTRAATDDEDHLNF